MDQALQDILWIAQRFRGVLDYLPELQKIVAVETTVKEREARLVELGIKEDEAKATVAKYLADVEGLKKTRSEKLAEIDSAVTTKIKDAEERAEAILEPARKEHALLNDSVAGLRTRAGELQYEIDQIEIVRDKLQSETSMLEQKLMTLNAKLKNLRESI